MPELYQPAGASSTTPVDFTIRKEVLLSAAKTDYTLFYHYGDLDATPVRHVGFLALLSNGERRSGELDGTGKAVLKNVAPGPVSIVYQHEDTDDDNDEIVEARKKLKSALDAIVVQTRLDMDEEWKEWNQAGWMKREYLRKINAAQGSVIGAWHWLSGTVEAVWQLAVLLNEFDKERRQLNYLFITGQWSEIDKKIAERRAKGEKMLEAASETKELLILIAHDKETRRILLSFAQSWWSVIPPDEQEELAANGGTQIIIDLVIGVLLGAFTAGTAGAAYTSAKWAAAGGRLGRRVAELLEDLKAAFQGLSKALKTKKRRTEDFRHANQDGTIETKWEPRRASVIRLLPFKLKPMHTKYIGEHLPNNDLWLTQVKYLDETERLRFKLTLKNGKLYDSTGKLYDTRGGQTVVGGGAKGHAIFVMDENGNFYASTFQKPGIFHHSSFLSGQPVAAAGEIEVTNGVVRSISDRSGHYMPDPSYLDQALAALEAEGVNIGSIRRKSW